MSASEPIAASPLTGNVAMVGFWAAILTAADAAVFAALGIATPARSGPMCGTLWPCVPAPYTDVAQFIPGDYLWLIPGILLAPIFVVLIAAIHGTAPEPRRIFGRVALAFAVAYAVVIAADYIVQFAVVIPRLERGETAGLSLITQYNPHGLFIAAEALGYPLMSLALLFAAAVFARGRIERAIRVLFVGGFVLAVAAFVVLWLGARDLIAFEVTILSINWVVLVTSGTMLAVVFRRAGRSTRPERSAPHRGDPSAPSGHGNAASVRDTHAGASLASRWGPIALPAAHSTADPRPAPVAETARMPAPAFTPSRRRLTALRMAAQHVGGRGLSTPVEAVRWMLALQAQDFPGVKWSVGLRQIGATEAAVEAACDAGEIVRSWPLRGTLHLVAGEDLGWLLALSAPRALASAAGRRAALGITDADLERARSIAAEALAGRRVMMRDALLAEFDGSGVSTLGQRGYHLLWHLAQTGTLVLGPTAGRQQAFALLDEWVRKPRQLERDESVAELALRYFRSHGPATAGDLARWSGLTVGDVRRGIATCATELTTLELDGLTYYLAPEPRAQAAPIARAHLLPGFDEYLLGYGDRTAALAAEHSGAVVPGGNGMFKPTIVVDGEVVGTWRRALRAREIVIELVPFDRISVGVREEVSAAAQAYGAFLGRPARLAGAEI